MSTRTFEEHGSKVFSASNLRFDGYYCYPMFFNPVHSSLLRLLQRKKTYTENVWSHNVGLAPLLLFPVWSKYFEVANYRFNLSVNVLKYL